MLHSFQFSMQVGDHRCAASKQMGHALCNCHLFCRFLHPQDTSHCSMTSVSSLSCENARLSSDGLAFFQETISLAGRYSDNRFASGHETLRLPVKIMLITDCCVPSIAAICFCVVFMIETLPEIIISCQEKISQIEIFILFIYLIRR